MELCHVEKNISTNLAVIAKNLSKRYSGETHVLNNFGMKVERGSTYGLLGSSGCGKTTVVSCLVGIQKWNSGELFVLGETPGVAENKNLGKRIGYVPQDLALYNQLLIFEIIQFYGRLYNIPFSKVKERWSFLEKLLELQTCREIIQNLSGGQKRRASLGLALLHKPELLILDEPTVGLDPLLRQKIWGYLNTLVETDKTTVIITTHYTEEARYLDRVGVMRNGRLIAEESPIDLLRKHGCELMEEVLMKLCRKDVEDANPSILASMDSNDRQLKKFENMQILRNLPTTDKTSRQLSCVSKFWQRAQNVYGLTLVMGLTLIRYPVFLVLLTIMPALQCSITVATTGSRIQNLHFGIVNDDMADWATNCPHFQTFGKTCDLKSISCYYFNKLKEDDLLVLESYESEKVALEQVHLGNIWGYLYTPAHYSNYLTDFAAEKRFASNQTLEGSRLSVKLDQSNYLIAYFIKKHLYESYLKHIANLADQCGLSKETSTLPLYFRPPVYGDYSDNYTNYLLPGDVLTPLMTLTTILCALIFVADYKRGTLSRARVAGLDIVDIGFSHCVLQTVIILLQTGILTAVNYLVFGLEVQGSPFLYILFCYLGGVFAIFLGLFIGIASRDEVACFVIGVYVFVIFVFFGGVVISSENTTKFWQQVGNFVPNKLPIASLRSVLVRELVITHELVWSGIVAICVWIFVLATLCIVIFKKLKL